jgi:hypothetical protein
MRNAFAFIVILGFVVQSAWGQERPLAYVLEHHDPWTRSARGAALLQEAGFDVQPLPFDRSPSELPESDMIFIGSFASEHPEYAAYMKEHAAALQKYVEGGKVLVQMTQADQTEVSPPFLFSTHGARRGDDDFGTAHVLSVDHPLVRGVAAGPISFHKTRTVWEAFDEQGGFEVIIAADEGGQRPALMEGAHGRGRIVLSAMALDKILEPASGRTPESDAAFAAFRTAFFANLSRYSVDVRDQIARAPKVTPGLWVAPFTPGSWTIAVLPDTQFYALRFPGIFTAQTGWIVNHRERRNIRMAIHLGDIVHNNTPREWQNARDAMRLLDGVVPYALVPGNHDYGPGGSATTRDTLLNEYFAFEAHAAQSTFGGAMEPGKLDNTYHLFGGPETGGREWIVVCLEWGPRDETVAWANEIMAQHADRTGILVTHAYMNNNDRRYDHTDAEHSQRYNPHTYKTPGPMNDGEQLWDKLVRKHNFALTLNGHVLGDGTGYLASKNDQGFTVHQMLSNFQMRELGGEGYMRLLEFQPDGRTVRIKSYSPVFDRSLTAPDHHFEIVLDQPVAAAPTP